MKNEEIRQSLIDMLKNDEKCYLQEIAWLKKQREYTKKDIDDAYLKGVSDCKDELEKQFAEIARVSLFEHYLVRFLCEYLGIDNYPTYNGDNLKKFLGKKKNYEN